MVQKGKNIINKIQVLEMFTTFSLFLDAVMMRAQQKTF